MKKDEHPTEMGRRGFLGALGALALGTTPLAKALANEAHEGSTAGHKHWLGMAIDLDLCTSCGACVVACKSENNVPPTGPDPARQGTDISWMAMLPLPTAGGERNDNLAMMPTPCMHCENPPCVKVCPVGATYQSDEGITAQIWDRCIGCRYCQTACPYSRRYFNWAEPNWLPSYRNHINPEVATRPRGVVEKCTFCSHRVRKVLERARIEGGDVPDEKWEHLTACAEACPVGAITFGNLNDPNSKVSHQSKSPRAFRLLEHLGTKPKVRYLAKDKRS